MTKDQHDLIVREAKRQCARHIIALVLVIAAIWAAAFLFAGCASLDKAAQGTEDVLTSPGIGEVVDAIPFGPMAAAGLLALINVYQAIRSRRYWTALRTVVQTVEPYIPADEAERTALRAKQGTTVTSLVKAAKASSQPAPASPSSPRAGA